MNGFPVRSLIGSGINLAPVCIRRHKWKREGFEMRPEGRYLDAGASLDTSAASAAAAHQEGKDRNQTIHIRKGAEPHYANWLVSWAGDQACGRGCGVVHLLTGRRTKITTRSGREGGEFEGWRLGNQEHARNRAHKNPHYRRARCRHHLRSGGFGDLSIPDGTPANHRLDR